MSDYYMNAAISRDDVVRMLTDDYENTVYVMVRVMQHILNARGTYDYDCICDSLNALDDDEQRDWREFAEDTRALLS